MKMSNTSPRIVSLAVGVKESQSQCFIHLKLVHVRLKLAMVRSNWRTICSMASESRRCIGKLQFMKSYKLPDCLNPSVLNTTTTWSSELLSLLHWQWVNAVCRLDVFIVKNHFQSSTVGNSPWVWEFHMSSKVQESTTKQRPLQQSDEWAQPRLQALTLWFSVLRRHHPPIGEYEDPIRSASKVQPPGMLLWTSDKPRMPYSNPTSTFSVWWEVMLVWKNCFDRTVWAIGLEKSTATSFLTSTFTCFDFSRWLFGIKDWIGKCFTLWWIDFSEDDDVLRDFEGFWKEESVCTEKVLLSNRLKVY